MYHIAYCETELTALVDLADIRRLPTTAEALADLVDVADQCEQYRCEAVLTDATGRPMGRVRVDGSWWPA